MREASQGARAVRFGVFEADLAAGELRKAGVKIKLQEQPFQLLCALLEHPGEVVTREELRQRLWPEDTYVDFDRSLNTAASRLREALGDSAANPRFVETLPRRGYRFLASVTQNAAPGAEKIDEAGSDAADGDGEVSEQRVPDDGADEYRRLRQRLRFAYLMAGGILLSAAAIIAGLWYQRPPVELPLRKLAIAVSPDARDPEISPDGRRVAYVAGETGRTLWVRDLDSDEPREIDGTDGASTPRWSPDSESVLFGAEGVVKRVTIAGGAPTVVCQMPGGWYHGGDWSPDGELIVFSAGVPARLYEVPARGGTAALIGPAGDSAASLGSDPRFLPLRNRRMVLYSSGWNDLVRVRDLSTGEGFELANGQSTAFSPTGHLIYRKPSDQLWALPFSLGSLQPAGVEFPIAQPGRTPSVARDGTLAFLHPGPATAFQLVWLNRRGERLRTTGQRLKYMFLPRLSHDDRRVATGGREAAAKSEIWTSDSTTDELSQFTFLSSQGSAGPVWSPSGSEIAFRLSADERQSLMVKAADGNGTAREVLRSQEPLLPTDWSPDGKCILYDLNHPGSDTDVWYIRREPDGRFEPVPFLKTAADERAARLSPDGRHVVYVSNESGSYEVYISEFPNGGGKRRISPHGGRQPVWCRSGREIFFLADLTLMSVGIDATAGLTVGTPKPLFVSDGFLRSGFVPQYDASLDGERFVIREPVGSAASAIWIVQNWHEEFR